MEHPNIVKLISYKENAIRTRGNEQTFVDYMALEYCENGELFDILSHSGKFDENMARYYFKQIVDGIQYCHE